MSRHVSPYLATQELYAAEGIAWRSVRWPDNSETIGLIASKERGRAPGPPTRPRFAEIRRGSHLAEAARARPRGRRPRP